MLPYEDETPWAGKGSRESGTLLCEKLNGILGLDASQSERRGGDTRGSYCSREYMEDRVVENFFGAWLRDFFKKTGCMR